ncbi:MAG TPA: hemolysin III family protein [Jatrophihabitantaceae bacterium]|jgi:hemolysin III
MTSIRPVESAAPVEFAQTTAQLYDSRRELHYCKPLWRGWLHLIWFALSLVIGPLTIALTTGSTRIAAVSVYVVSVSTLFGTSAVYHRGNWSAEWMRRLQRLDHAMIFLLIAGTATPAFLIAVPGRYGVIGLGVMWTLAVGAIVIHLAWMSAPEKVMGAAFIGLGLVAGLAIPAVWINAGLAAAVLMLVGGGLYVVGAVSYHRRRPDPYPASFGYHEVFHAYVCAAATCQYIAIAIFIA